MHAINQSIELLFQKISPYCDKTNDQYDPELHAASTDALTVLQLLVSPLASPAKSPPAVLPNGYCPAPLMGQSDQLFGASEFKELLNRGEFDHLRLFCESGSQHKALLERFLVEAIELSRGAKAERSVVGLFGQVPEGSRRCPSNSARVCNCAGRCADDDCSG